VSLHYHRQRRFAKKIFGAPLTNGQGVDTMTGVVWQTGTGNFIWAKGNFWNQNQFRVAQFRVALASNVGQC
jgi:hypothetical protein